MDNESEVRDYLSVASFWILIGIGIGFYIGGYFPH